MDSKTETVASNDTTFVSTQLSGIYRVITSRNSKNVHDRRFPHCSPAVQQQAITVSIYHDLDP
jgi:hypothetical protein